MKLEWWDRFSLLMSLFIRHSFSLNSAGLVARSVFVPLIMKCGFQWRWCVVGDCWHLTTSSSSEVWAVLSLVWTFCKPTKHNDLILPAGGRSDRGSAGSWTSDSVAALLSGLWLSSLSPQCVTSCVMRNAWRRCARSAPAWLHLSSGWVTSSCCLAETRNTPRHDVYWSAQHWSLSLTDCCADQ